MARCTVERLMGELGIAGARPGEEATHHCPGPADAPSSDLLERDFTAVAPARRWVADITYVHGCRFCVYRFVTDLFSRRIVGWQVVGYAAR